MKDYPINIFYSEADRGYIADIPDLDACSAFGKHLPKRSSKRKSRNEPGWQLRALKKSPFPNRDIVLPSIKPTHNLVRPFRCAARLVR